MDTKNHGGTEHRIKLWIIGSWSYGIMESWNQIMEPLSIESNYGSWDHGVMESKDLGSTEQRIKLWIMESWNQRIMESLSTESNYGSWNHGVMGSWNQKIMEPFNHGIKELWIIGSWSHWSWNQSMDHGVMGS